METWISGKPTTPGWYLLEFSGGSRFLVVRAFVDKENKFDDEATFCMESQDNFGHVNDDVDVVTKHLPIPDPNPRGTKWN